MANHHEAKNSQSHINKILINVTGFKNTRIALLPGGRIPVTEPSCSVLFILLGLLKGKLDGLWDVRVRIGSPISTTIGLEDWVLLQDWARLLLLVLLVDLDLGEGELHRVGRFLAGRREDGSRGFESLCGRKRGRGDEAIGSESPGGRRDGSHCRPKKR